MTSAAALIFAGDLADELLDIADEELRDVEIARCLRVIAEVSESDAHTRLIDLADEIENQIKRNIERRAEDEAVEAYYQRRTLWQRIGAAL